MITMENEIETIYEKHRKGYRRYRSSIETMLALGLEDRLVATAGLDNEVPDDLKEAFSKTNYLDEFTPIPLKLSLCWSQI